MDQKRSSYTDEEIQQFRADINKKEPKWGMIHKSGTVWIPFDKIKEDHLINIIDHIEKYEQNYDLALLKEFKIRLAQKTRVGMVLYGTK
jgi:hypothetical protein